MAMRACRRRAAASTAVERAPRWAVPQLERVRRGRRSVRSRGAAGGGAVVAGGGEAERLEGGGVGGPEERGGGGGGKRGGGAAGGRGGRARPGVDHGPGV